MHRGFVHTSRMLQGRPILTAQLQAAYLGVRRLIDSAPLNDKQMAELEEYVKTFWKIAIQISATTGRRDFDA